MSIYMNSESSAKDVSPVYIPPSVSMMEFQCQEILSTSNNPYPKEEDLY